jgi:hypothetical protein
MAVVRIVATYHDFNQAYDEPAHIACGMEWLDKGTFKMEPQHPPLPRVMAALGPYLAGLRLPEVGYVGGNRANGYDFYGTGNQILYARGQYPWNLTLARLGTLPFFVLAAWVTFLWTRSLLGDWPGVWAVFLLTMLPVVLGYSTLAYVDPALMAMFPAALLAFTRWLDAPGWRRSMVLGCAVAGAALSNTPWMVFLPPCFVAILACRWWAEKRWAATRREERGEARAALRECVRRWTGQVVVALLAACFVLWGGYRFSVERLDTVFDNPGRALQQLHLPPLAKSLVAKVIEINPPIPAPAFFQGLGRAIGENSKLYPAYLLGKVKRGGWWYFYFFMLAFKTPPAFLLLALAGSCWALKRFWREKDWRMAAPAVCVVVTLLVGTTIKVNLGVRTILFVYPLLAILGAVGCKEILYLEGRWRRVAILPILLLAQLGVYGAWIHPNYLTYTSDFAGGTPDYSLVLDADYDAGQNVLRLAQVLRDHKVGHLKLRLYTSADLTQMGLPPFETLAPFEKATGWVAVSAHNLRTGEGPWYPAMVDGYAWLNAYEPVALVDKTIRLYYVAEGRPSGTGPPGQPSGHP